MLNKKALAATAAAAEPVYVEDVFSTYLYTGNGSTQTITNGIDLSGEGGMVWLKTRSGIDHHNLYDTERGATKKLSSSGTGAEQTLASGLTAFNSDGFSLGDQAGHNENNVTMASWTFRKAEKFFDVVTYTGDGTAGRTVAHNLGSTPGCVIVKRTDAATNWPVWHRGTTAGHWLKLNLTDASASQNTIFGNNSTYINPTSTEFTVGTNSAVNASGGTYVAYLFAHDAGGFGDAGDQSIIKCGSYTGNGSTTGPSVNLGWEPQWVLVKNASAAYGWYITDNLRGFINSDTDPVRSLLANATSTEATYASPKITSTGFDVIGTSDAFNTSGSTYVYIAIRRGPMKTPTDATKVFTPTVYTGTNVDNRLIDTTIAPDMAMIRQRDDTVVLGMYVGTRLTGQEFLLTGSNIGASSDADSFDQQLATAEYGNAFSSMNGVWVGNDATRKFNANTASNNHIIEAFKRAPGFFDMVCYTGTGSATTISHNLGVTPEMMWIKRRNTTTSWAVYANNDNTDYLVLNSDSIPADDNTYWNDTSPTSSVFTVGTNASTNLSGATYIAFLFASCPGVSKVGTYTGTGTTAIDVDCGFTNGARFVLIKNISQTASWCVLDTARGIVAGNDPFLFLDANNAETTTADRIDPYSPGFTVAASNNTFFNSSGDTFIYLAIA